MVWSGVSGGMQDDFRRLKTDFRNQLACHEKEKKT
jgi:hypothetical protein